MKLIRILICAAAVVLVAGCGGAGSPASVSAPPPATASITGPATVRSNQAAAAAEADRLLALASVPPGAQVTDPAGTVLSGPATGTPAAASVESRTRAWKVDLPFDQALAWVRAHPPAGLTDGGQSSMTMQGRQSAGDEYDAPASAAWAVAQLQVGTGRLTATSSIIRADAQVTWLDPAPSKDQQKGRRIHVDVSSGCPKHDRSIVGVRNTGTDLAARLLPAAVPSAALVCRYDGLNGHPFTLVSRRTLDSAAAARLARSVAAEHLSHTDGGIVHCPMDDGSAAIVALSYSGRADVDLWMNTNGCTSIANGFVVTRI